MAYSYPFEFYRDFYNKNTLDLSCYILKGNSVGRERWEGSDSKCPEQIVMISDCQAST